MIKLNDNDEYTEEEIAANRTAWVEALRSNNYKQGLGALKRKVEDETKYCCLGVACEISGIVQEEVFISPAKKTYLFDSPGFSLVLPDRLTKALNINSAGGLKESAESLASLNDKGISFEEIATIIEEDKLMNNNEIWDRKPASKA